MQSVFHAGHYFEMQHNPAAIQPILRNEKAKLMKLASGDTLLHAAASAGIDEVVEQLLKDSRFSIHGQTLSGSTPLHKSTYSGRVSTTQLLLKHGANPNTVDMLGKTPLHYAIINKHQAMIDLLQPVTQIKKVVETQREDD